MAEPVSPRCWYRKASPYLTSIQGSLPGPSPGEPLPGTGRPALWDLLGDPRSEPKACAREVGSFGLVIRVTLHTLSHPGCREMDRKTLLQPLGAKRDERPEVRPAQA